jgi:hypothetical protein
LVFLFEQARRNRERKSLRASGTEQEVMEMWENIAQEFPVTWKSRREHLPPAAVAGRGVSRCIIMERLRRRTPAELAALHIVVADDYFVVMGECGTLPWVSGSFYLGRDPDAPTLLLPTALEPTLPVNLLEEVIHTRFPMHLGQTAVFPHPLHLMPLANARLLTDDAVFAWLWNGRNPVHAQSAAA